MNEINLKELERRAYLSYHQDGLIDIFVGIYILLFGSGILLKTATDFTTWFTIPAIIPAIMIPVWISIKKRITIPRIGYVKFGFRSVSRLTAIFLGLVVAGLGVFIVFGLGASMGQNWALTLRNLIVSYGMLVIGIGAALISSLFAYVMGLKRLYMYGLLTLVLFITNYFVAIPLEYLLLTIGLVIIVYGFVLLMQFIRKYPLPQGDHINAGKAI